MAAKRPDASLPAEEQVRNALSLLSLYGAPPEKDLWHAIDHVVMKRRGEISRLEMKVKTLEARKV